MINRKDGGCAGALGRLGMYLVLLLCVVLAPTSSRAIVWGEPDGDAHPNVGALILRFDGFSPIPSPGVPANTYPICSGSLIAREGSRGLFLTAGHCVDALMALLEAFAPLQPVPAVSFSSNLHVDPGVAVPVAIDSVYWDFSDLPPGALPSGFKVGVLRETRDIALLVLEAGSPADLPMPVELPGVGLLDSLGSSDLRRSEFRAVGFGDDITPPTPHTRAFVFGVREVAHPRPVNLTQYWLVTQQNGPSGSSGIYFGDSGCPIFWVNPATGRETQVALGSAPVGNESTATVSQHFRIDTSHAMDFITAVKILEGL